MSKRADRDRGMVARYGFGSVVRSLLTLWMVLALSQVVRADESANVIGRLIDEGAYQEALQRIDNRTRESGIDDPSLMMLKGAVLVRLGRLDEGMELFEALAIRYPKDAAIHNNIGVIHAERGELDLARQAFERAIKISPGYQQAIRNLADIHADLACRTYGQLPTDPDITIPSFCVAAEPQPLVKTPQSGVAIGNQDGLSDGLRLEALETLEQWRSAWETQDLKRYLGFYSVRFAPEGLSFSQWRNKRERSITRPKWIKIRLGAPIISMANSQITVRFKQHYSASNYQDTTTKQLVFVFEGAGWKIMREWAI